MVTNIMRFTQQIRQQQALGLMVRVGSLLEAEAWIDVSSETSTPLMIILDDRLGGALLDERVRYLAEYIEARGAVVGIGYYSDGSEPQVRMALLAGCSYVQVNVIKWKSKAPEMLAYLSRLAHGMDAYLEAVVGEFRDGAWKSAFATEFDLKRLVADTRVDALGVMVPEGVVSDWKKSGKKQLNEDFLHASSLKTGSMLCLHGASLGSSWIPNSKVLAKHPYREVTGISEQALMRVSEKGIRYVVLDHDLRNIIDMAYRAGSPDSGLYDMSDLKAIYRTLITSYLAHCNNLVAKTYAL